MALKSTAESSVELELCIFESNTASRGGALYFIGEGRSFIRGSRFYQNVAGENSPGGIPRLDINDFVTWTSAVSILDNIRDVLERTLRNVAETTCGRQGSIA